MLVVVVKGQAKAAKELLKLWLAGESRSAGADEIEHEIASLMTEAYRS